MAPLEKIRVFDTRVERPPHYDTFGEFQYAYHYGDMYAPYIKQEEPLKTECQHFLDCIRTGSTPVSCGLRGMELVKILEASSESLRRGGAPVECGEPPRSERDPSGAAITRATRMPTAKFLKNGLAPEKKNLPRAGRKAQVKIVLNGNGH